MAHIPNNTHDGSRIEKRSIYSNPTHRNVSPHKDYGTIGDSLDAAIIERTHLPTALPIFSLVAMHMATVKQMLHLSDIGGEKCHEKRGWPQLMPNALMSQRYPRREVDDRATS